MQEKHILYIIGGPAKVGKTELLHHLISKKSINGISTDQIREIIKYHLKNPITGVLPGNFGIATIPLYTHLIKQKISQIIPMQSFKFLRDDDKEDDTGWLGTTYILNIHDQTNTESIVVEGVAVKPRRVAELKEKFKHFDIKSVFMGYSSKLHIECIKKLPGYLINANENNLKDAVTQGILRSNEDKESCKSFGYSYLDCGCCTTNRSFEDQLNMVTDYLLSN